MLTFISHSSKDQIFIEEKLLPFLHEHGISTWCSTADIKTADEWERGIRSGLKSSEYFLVVLSPNAIESDWVRAEVLWAMKNRKGKVVPILFKSCEPEDLHLQLPMVQLVDLRDGNNTQWRKLSEVWPLKAKTFKLGAVSFTFLGLIQEGHQVFLFRKALILTTWNGSEMGPPIDMFKSPMDNPKISALEEGEEMKAEGEELFTIPNGADWSVRFYRLDFPNRECCWFDSDTLKAINAGNFYVVPVQKSGVSIFGIETMKEPLLTAILVYTSQNANISVLVAISPGTI